MSAPIAPIDYWQESVLGHYLYMRPECTVGHLMILIRVRNMAPRSVRFGDEAFRKMKENEEETRKKTDCQKSALKHTFLTQNWMPYEHIFMMHWKVV